jgi:hypothetical protein
MSEQNERGSIRRVSRRDRKRRLDTRGPLFPVEEPVETPPEQPVIENTPEVDVPSASRHPAERAKVVSPPEERFPPLIPYVEEPPTAPVPVPAKPRSNFLPNVIAVFFFLATLAALALLALITVNPYTPLNPFPPFTPVPILITATPGPSNQLPPVDLGRTPTFTPLPANVSEMPFMLTANGVVYAPNGNGQACNWSSIAGSVTDSKGAALDGYRILITDVKGDEKTVFSGSAQTFGPGGFELFLNGTPLEAQYSVQLLTPQGAPASEPYTVTTRSDCQSNVAILSFVQRGAS